MRPRPGPGSRPRIEELDYRPIPQRSSISDAAKNLRRQAVEGTMVIAVDPLALGHQTVWHIDGPGDWLEARDCARGWCDTLVRLGAEVPCVVRDDSSSRVGVVSALASLIFATQPSRPTSTTACP